MPVKDSESNTFDQVCFSFFFFNFWQLGKNIRS